MGRKEKSVNTSMSPAQSSIISKRTYTRQIQNKTINQTESSLNTANQPDNINMDANIETHSKQLEESNSNNTEYKIQNIDLANGSEVVMKGKRRSNKNTTDPTKGLVQTTNTISSIAQRPRRQVKHKFIKSANVIVIEESKSSATNSEVIDESTSSLTLLNSLSPNSKLRLVPMIHRLPMNTAKLNWQNAINESTEVQPDGVTSMENEITIPNIIEIEMESHSTPSDSKHTSSKVRHLQQIASPVDRIESNNTSEIIFEEEEEEVAVESHESTVSESILTSAFDDDEDDIMIVEEKDALDVPDQIEYVAEEVIIEETGIEYAEIICVSPKYMNQISNSDNESSKENDVISIENEPHDNNERVVVSVVEPTEQCDNQTEPIYLSDSMSCFDSDSDTQDSQMPASSIDESEQANVSEVSQQTGDDDGPLNESIDDVIILPEGSVETIEIDRSDTEDCRLANTYSFEMCIESDSQPSQSLDSVNNENTENGFKSGNDSPQLYETTTDADDDSSEVEKRSSRTRRDNILRKNYSCRRSYSKRRNKNDSESSQHLPEFNETKNEDDSSTESLCTSKIDGLNVAERLSSDEARQCQSNPIAFTATVPDSNTTDGTDEENSFDVDRVKTVRTYVRKKATLSQSTSDVNDLNVSISRVKSSEKIETDSQSENTTSSGDIDTKVINLNPAPRKRGRPKKQINMLIDLNSLKKSEPTVVTESHHSSDNKLTPILPETHNITDIDETNQSMEIAQCETKLEPQLPIASTSECEEQFSVKIKDEVTVSHATMEMDSTESKINENAMDVENIIETEINTLEQGDFVSNQVVIEVNSVESQPAEAPEVMDYVEEVVNSDEDCTEDQKNIELVVDNLAISQSAERIEQKGQVIQETKIEESIVEVSTVDDQSIVESTSEKGINLIVAPAQEQMFSGATIEKSSTPEVAIENAIIPQPIKTESAVECISAKIEQITIDTKHISNKQSDGILEIASIDSKLDIKNLEIKSDEVKVKADEVQLKKEIAEAESALVEFPKEVIDEIGDTSIRRSGRIRTINKTKQRAQGFGLVKDKKRAPVLVDEDSSNASFEVSTDNNADKDLTTSNAEPIRIKTEEELEKEKVDRENGMKLFVPIIDNEYRSERIISKEAKKMTCDCFLTHAETERGEMGCGDDCLNRMLLIECGPKCVVADRCTNRRFQTHDNSACNIFKTEKKGYGLIATSYISAGQFIMEYVGEVLNSKQFEKRANDYSKQMNAHYYFMALSSDCVIDATKKGNISRFINHSCDPNAETQKWTVNGELRIGFFSKKPIMPEDEITFDYQFQRYGKEAQKCYCEAVNCRGWIGGEPESEEELESDDDEESDDEASADTVSKDENELSESKAAVTSDEVGKKKTKAPKPKKPRDATKKPARKERAKANRTISTDFKKHMKRAEIMEDPDLDKEIDELAMNGLKNQVQTLQFSRLMVRAKLQKAKLRLLLLLREGEFPCRRLFLDYHGLKLMHSWMSDANSTDRLLSLTFRLEILQTLEKLPIKNKTMLQDSKVLSTVQRWSTTSEYTFLTSATDATSQKMSNVTNDESSPSDSGSGTPILNDETSSPKVDETTSSENPIVNPEPSNIEQKPSESPSGTTGVKPSDVLDTIPQLLEQNSTLKGMGLDLLKSIISTTEKNTKIIEDTGKLPDGEIGKLVREICLLASKLVSSWEQLPESFKIPKKLRIEQMKEHEREADESYKENVEEKTAQKAHNTFSSSGRFSERSGKTGDTTDSREKDSREKDPREKDPRFRRFNPSTLSKFQRRQMFEAKVAQEEAELKKTMEHRIHEARCAFFQLDPRLTRDFMVPVCVNPTTGQWFGDKMIKISTPPSHSHIKPPPVPLPTDINEYIIPPIDLPDQWKYAINEKGQIYYYHTKILIPQWEPPIKLLPLMEEHRINDIDIKVEAIDTPLHAGDEDHEMEHDCDDEDEDVVSILSNSTNCLLELKSDPILEKYNDDDTSSIDSDDSLVNELAELEAKYFYIKKKTDDYWTNMKKPPNLNEEIAAMAKSDPTCISIQSVENIRARDEEKQNHSVDKSNATEQRKSKKCRAQLVQEIRISPLSEEMKRELRRDSRRYKENKAKLRRQKEILLKRKNELKHADAPVRKLKKITEGLPQVSKHSTESDFHGPIDSHSFSITSFSSSRYNNDSFDSKRAKSSAFTSLSGGLSVSSISLNSSLNALDTPTRNPQSARNSLPSTSLTQSIVNKLPSIGHKFVGDTEELIMKNTIKPIKPAEPVITPVTTPVVNTIRSTPTPQTQQQQNQQQLIKKPSHPIPCSAKSSPKPLPKKKKTSDPNECIDVNSPAAKRIKEKFKLDISGDIVRHLKPYFSKTCTVGQIQSSDDFRHLARKLTLFVMLKELKYCNNVSLLEVTDSVKNKAREYIKKYMSKFGKTYIRDENEKDYHFEDL